ncbi:hypothetical protein [Actinomadura madurae]
MTQTATPPPAGQVHDHVAVARDVVKSYGTGDGAVTALRGVSAAFPGAGSPRSWGRPGPGSRRSCTAWPGSTP